MTEKPFAPACERNRDPILEVLQTHLVGRRHVLEIGSGTGQHAVHFAAALSTLTWQTSDRPSYLPGIRAWLDEARLANTPPPLALDVTLTWPQARFDAVFTANTLHIMSWNEVVAMFSHLPEVLDEDAVLIVYGPFRYRGRHTSESNAAFDASLRANASERGIRDFEEVDALAHVQGFELVEDRAMPANNRCLVWQRGHA